MPHGGLDIKRTDALAEKAQACTKLVRMVVSAKVYLIATISDSSQVWRDCTTGLRVTGNTSNRTAHLPMSWTDGRHSRLLPFVDKLLQPRNARWLHILIKANYLWIMKFVAYCSNQQIMLVGSTNWPVLLLLIWKSRIFEKTIDSKNKWNCHSKYRLASALWAPRHIQKRIACLTRLRRPASTVSVTFLVVLHVHQ